MAKAAELTKKIDEMIDTLIDAINSDDVNDAFKAYRKQAAKFTYYSLHNQVLIMVQDPNATRVAGYKAWYKFDRHVMKGEHGIGILAPHKYQSMNDKGVIEDCVGFHGTTVFDVRQTEGEPLIDLVCVGGEGGEELYDRMVTYSESLGMPVVTADDPGSADGSCQASMIKIKDGLSMQYKIGVLAHELGHHLSKHIKNDDGKSSSVMEWEAETISYIVCEHFEIENKAPLYLKSWKATRDGIKASLGIISKVSSKIIIAMEE